MKSRFRVTYETWTEEAVDVGETYDRGYALPGGWKFKLEDIDDPIENYELNLHQVRDYFCGSYEDSGRWFNSIDADEDYSTGEWTLYAIHPPENITPASYQRLKRLFTKAR